MIIIIKYAVSILYLILIAMQAEEPKQQISIWGIIQLMMEEEAKQTKDKAQYLQRPHLFRDYSIKKDVRSIYQYFKDIHFIPKSMVESSCYFNVQVVEKQSQVQTNPQQMINEEDKNQIIKNFNLRRERNYQRILQEAQNKEKSLCFCRNFSQTFEEIITKILGSSKNFQNQFQLRIYFIWKHYEFTFLGKAQTLKLIGFYQQNHDQLFRRAIAFYPPFSQLLKQMTQWQGIRKRQLNFKKLRIYQNKDGQTYKYKFPNAKICLSPEGQYYLKIKEE